MWTPPAAIPSVVGPVGVSKVICQLFAPSRQWPAVTTWIPSARSAPEQRNVPAWLRKLNAMLTTPVKAELPVT